MEVDQILIPIREVQSIEVYKINWIDIEVINTTIDVIKEVSTKKHLITKTYNEKYLLGLRTKEVEVTDSEELPLVRLETISAPSYALTINGVRKLFVDTYEKDHSTGLHYRELNGKSELTMSPLVCNHVPGSALIKLKEYIQGVLPGVDYKIVDHNGKLRLRVGPYMRVRFNNKVGYFNCGTNSNLLRKVAALSNHSELIHFY